MSESTKNTQMVSSGDTSSSTPIFDTFDRVTRLAASWEPAANEFRAAAQSCLQAVNKMHPTTTSYEGLAQPEIRAAAQSLTKIAVIDISLGAEERMAAPIPRMKAAIEALREELDVKFYALRDETCEKLPNPIWSQIQGWSDMELKEWIAQEIVAGIT